jgi:ribosomal protein S8
MSHIANLISCIKVGVKCSKTQIYYSGGPKFLVNLIKAIYDEGLVLRYVVSRENFLTITVFLKSNLIKDIKIVSTPGRKLYTTVYQLQSEVFKNPRFIYFISTSRYGIISSNTALKMNVGGEVLCVVKF